jgi:hypothetical protein
VLTTPQVLFSLAQEFAAMIVFFLPHNRWFSGHPSRYFNHTPTQSYHP